MCPRDVFFLGTCLLSRSGSSVFILWEEIFGGVPVEGFLAAFRAKVVDFAVEFGSGGCRIDVDLHTTDGVFDHSEHRFLLSCLTRINVGEFMVLSYSNILCFCRVSRYTACFFPTSLLKRGTSKMSCLILRRGYTVHS